MTACAVGVGCSWGAVKSAVQKMLRHQLRDVKDRIKYLQIEIELNGDLKGMDKLKIYSLDAWGNHSPPHSSTLYAFRKLRHCQLRGRWISWLHDHGPVDQAPLTFSWMSNGFRIHWNLREWLKFMVLEYAARIHYASRSRAAADSDE